MATTAFDDLLSEIAPWVPGCPSPVVLFHLRSATIDLCRQSLIWLNTLADIVVTSASFPLTLTPPNNTEVTQIREVFFDGQRLIPWAPHAYDSTITDWRTEVGNPTMWVSEIPGVITVVKLPKTSGVLKVVCALAPTHDASGADSWLIGRYRQGLVSGAISRICSIPGQSFSNPDMAMLHAPGFNLAVSRAIVDARRGFAPAQARVQYVRVT